MSYLVFVIFIEIVVKLVLNLYLYKLLSFRKFLLVRKR